MDTKDAEGLRIFCHGLTQIFIRAVLLRLFDVDIGGCHQYSFGKGYGLFGLIKGWEGFLGGGVDCRVASLLAMTSTRVLTAMTSTRGSVVTAGEDCRVAALLAMT